MSGRGVAFGSGERKELRGLPLSPVEGVMKWEGYSLKGLKRQAPEFIVFLSLKNLSAQVPVQQWEQGSPR